MPESRRRRRRSQRASRGSTPPARPAASTPRKRRTNYLYVIASAVIAVLVIAGFAVGGLNLGQLGSGSGTGNSDTYVPGIGEEHEILPPSHVAEPETVEYNSTPPTSGAHWPEWARCGFYEEELPDERIVHNLEHSNIVVSYNLSSQQEVDQLRDVLGDTQLFNTHGVARAYTEIPEGTVALSAWGVSDTMEGIDQGRIQEFFETYAGTLGPEGNISCLNSGITP